ncbi:MAG: hypothetical protein M1823_006536, partial [Watsoniomyces obsoletus]
VQREVNQRQPVEKAEPARPQPAGGTAVADRTGSLAAKPPSHSQMVKHPADPQAYMMAFVEQVRGTDFYRPSHELVYEAIIDWPGAPVGDPAEYESVRQVLGGTNRSSALMLGSVKGLVGHAECTSGILSLIKTLLMILKAKIPPQASFTAMNPAIKASAADHIKIPTTLQVWDARFRAALINNYGASGSNASLVITQAPTINTIAPSHRSAPLSGPGRKYPFWLAGLDDRSLRAYSRALRSYIRRDPGATKELSLPQLAFNVARQSNRHLDRSLMCSCRSTDELEASLLSYENGASKL